MNFLAAADANPSDAATRARGSTRSLLRALAALCLALLFYIPAARAQAGRVRPDPKPSPTPGAQQRPRRVAHDTEDAPPGEPSSPAAPSRAGSLPQPTPSGAQQKNQGAKPGSPDAIDDDEVLNVESNLVPVSASVTDALGHAVTDLKLEDFELRVDGQPKPISDISRAETPVRLALLFDNSSSLRPTRELEKQAAINFFRRVIRTSDQASIFSISTVPSLDQPLTGDVSRLVRTIERYGEAEGSTSLFDTIVMAAEYLRPQPGRKVMIIVSDGVETTSQLEDYGEMVRRVLASDCQVFVIQTGLSENANLRDLTAERRMQDLTSYTGGFVYVPRQPSDLEVAFAQIAADLAQQYVLSYYPNDDASDGRFRAINVRVKSRGDVRVRARRGYYPRHRDNLSANAPAAQPSELAASVPEFIRDPAAPPQATTAQRRSPVNVNANARTADANAGASSVAVTDSKARAPAVAANASRHGNKNLDPDADEGTTDAGAQPRPQVKIGSSVPPQETEQGADGSPPTRQTVAAPAPSPAELKLQPAPQPSAQPTTQPTLQASQPGEARSNANQSAAADAKPITPVQSNTNTSPAQNDSPRPSSPSQPQSQSGSQPQPQSQTRPRSSSQSQQKQSQQSTTQQAASSQDRSARPAPAAPGDAPKKPQIISGGVLNSRARTLPVPAYPETARRMRVGGTVVVEVTIDEGGKVIEARAASGPLLLRESAVVAARRATFPPQNVEGQPAQLKGVLNYTFTF